MLDHAPKFTVITAILW